MTGPQQIDQQFWSIERAVAFVLIPIATPLSGALALWLGRHFPGVHVTGDAIYAFAATTAGGVAAGLIKWLDGRTKFLASVAQAENKLAPVAALLPPNEREALIQDVKGVIQSEVAKLSKRLPRSTRAIPMPEWQSPGDPAPN